MPRYERYLRGGLQIQVEELGITTAETLEMSRERACIA